MNERVGKEITFNSLKTVSSVCTDKDLTTQSKIKLALNLTKLQ